MISLKIREKETEKTARRAITQCQDKEKSPESIPSRSYTTAIKNPLIRLWKL